MAAASPSPPPRESESERGNFSPKGKERGRRNHEELGVAAPTRE